MGSAEIPKQGDSQFIYLRDLAAFAINAPGPATACVIQHEAVDAVAQMAVTSLVDCSLPDDLDREPRTPGDAATGSL